MYCEKCGEEIPEQVAKGMGLRISITIITGIGWLVFLILWLAFYAGNHSGYQNLAIALASILIVGAIIGPVWVTWGMKFGKNFDRKVEKSE